MNTSGRTTIQGPYIQGQEGTDNQPKKLRTMDDVRAIASKWVEDGPVRAVVVFGSHARNEALTQNTIDVACIVEDETGRKAMHKIAQDQAMTQAGGDVHCALIVTTDELRQQAHRAHVLGALIHDGKLLAGDQRWRDGISVRNAPTPVLATLLASGLEQIRLTLRGMPDARHPMPGTLRAWDAMNWKLSQLKNRYRTETAEGLETLTAWNQRRRTRLAITGAEQIARLVATTAELTQTGARMLEAQMLKIRDAVPTDEGWRLEALARATRTKHVNIPRTVNVGDHDTNEEIEARVKGVLHGTAWWLRHGNRTVHRAEHTEQVEAVLNAESGRKAMELTFGGTSSDQPGPPSLDELVATCAKRW